MDCRDSIYDLLKLLELALDMGVKLIPGQFLIVKYDEISLLLDRIEENIPEEIVKANSQLIRSGNEFVYKIIDEMRKVLNRSFVIIPKRYVILDTKKMYILIDGMYENLPAEILEARKILNS